MTPVGLLDVSFNCSLVSPPDLPRKMAKSPLPLKTLPVGAPVSRLLKALPGLLRPPMRLFFAPPKTATRDLRPAALLASEGLPSGLCAIMKSLVWVLVLRLIPRRRPRCAFVRPNSSGKIDHVERILNAWPWLRQQVRTHGWDQSGPCRPPQRASVLLVRQRWLPIVLPCSNSLMSRTLRLSPWTNPSFSSVALCIGLS